MPSLFRCQRIWVVSSLTEDNCCTWVKTSGAVPMRSRCTSFGGIRDNLLTIWIEYEGRNPKWKRIINLKWQLSNCYVMLYTLKDRANTCYSKGDIQWIRGLVNEALTDWFKSKPLRQTGLFPQHKCHSDLFPTRHYPESNCATCVNCAQ